MERGYIDIYCERIGPGLWAEPFNAVTNLAFIIAAFFLVRMILRADAVVRRDPAVWVLTGLVFVIGIGSGLFHTFASRWALLMDVIPIAFFILIYTWYAVRRLAGAPVWVSVLSVAAVLGLAMAIPLLTGLRGGTYFAALAALVVIGGYLKFRRGHAGGPALLVAAGTFAVSLTFRTIDAPLCEAVPVGTHFMWHMLNGCVLFIVVRALVLFGRRV
ncbi:MAG: hypothetical protein ACI9JL_003638 [Paracoccaceae bacterium]|jgi:hypothetical protein